jgi:hypothetical protein
MENVVKRGLCSQTTFLVGFEAMFLFQMEALIEAKSGKFALLGENYL